jgi:DNA-binding NarL/FixJ family response regulator
MKDASHNQDEDQNNRRVLIIDDHPLVRESLKKIIQKEPDLTVCGEAEDRDQALELVAITKPHLTIVDLTLKNSYGLELIKDLRDQHPEVQILVLSMHDEALHAERVVRAGAHGYISKQEISAKILTAIRQVLDGQIYWSEKAAARVASKIARQPHSIKKFSVDLLSDREMQVFELLGTGHNNRQIADALHIDSSTVETYRSRIKEKLNLKSAVELFQYAICWSNNPKL